MKPSAKFLSIFLVLFVFVALVHAETDLPINKKRLSDRVLIVWACDYMQSIATVALATEKGIVVIETSLIRAHDKKIRKVIEQEFGRKDFKYLINTHFHHDHTCGNQVYADAVIVGHKNIPAGMKQELTGEGLVKLIEKFENMKIDRKKALDASPLDSDEYKYHNEFLVCLELVIPELKSGFIPYYPSILFEKNMILDMGDITCELYSFGGTHTDSDIVICIPEEGLVVIGDVSPDKWIPYLRKDARSDHAVTLDHWGRIINADWEIKHVHMAHSDMYLSVESFKQQYNYLRTLWDELTELKRQNISLEEAKKKFPFKERFPYFWDPRYAERKTLIHLNNLEVIWERISK